LLYYVTTPSGAPLSSPGFVKIGTDGLALIDGDDDKTYVRLDIERPWLFTREVLMSDKARVQWMFVSRGVEALLIDYARARGEEPYLVWRAETMLLEPGDSTPHDDHMHLRLACLPEEELTGCEGGGPRWEWLGASHELGELDSATLADIARDDPFGLEEAMSTNRAGGDA
jgi:penicillin-insensitive murein endopeptidase